jgi:ATP-dependent RNA/DNA helicase IGHMBP2
MIDSEEYFEKLSRWIDWESEAEKERLVKRRERRNAADAEKSGETILDLAIVDHEVGLGGRYLFSFVKRNRTLSLPWNRLKVGSPVNISDHEESDQPINGVVSRRDNKSIQVATSKWPEGSRFRLDLSPDEVTRKRMLAALKVANIARGRTAELRRIILDDREPRFSEPQALMNDVMLNESQKSAVEFALAADDIAIIHGPPGTGKTTAIIELICQAVERGETVLACAPSNTAVDNILERLVAQRQRLRGGSEKVGSPVVRVGHPARVGEDLRAFTLDALVAKHEVTSIVQDMHKEAEALFRKIGRYSRAKPAPGAKYEMRREAKRLKSDARMLEKQAVEYVLDKANVICGTTTFDEELLSDRRFDLVVIDEACQSTEPGSWIPVLRAERLVLAGDHKQLPPTVLSDRAAKDGFNISLLERLVEIYGEPIKRQLDVQYRMHEDIMRFSSQQFYGGTLLAHESVESHLLTDLPTVLAAEISESVATELSSPANFIDTAGAGWNEELEPDGESKRNPSEGEFVLRKVRQLCEAGVPSEDIAVIAPYAAQVRWLRSNWDGDNLEIDTVDGFQGREKEAVVISCVRSNSTGEIGFLADTRRMNVALTRAKRKLIVVGDSSTLANNEFYAAMLEYFESINGYSTVWDDSDGTLTVD